MFALKRKWKGLLAAGVPCQTDPGNPKVDRGRLALVRLPQFDQLVEHAAHRVDVRLDPIWTTSTNFGRQIVGSANHSGCLRAFGVQLLADAEVTELVYFRIIILLYGMHQFGICQMPSTIITRQEEGNISCH
jgi:hypothetical protein